MKEQNEHINDTPELNKLKGKQPFGVPNGYFADLENRIKNKLSEETIIPKQDGFKVPTDYFNSLAEKVEQKKRKGRVIPLFTVRKLGYAASVIGIISLSIWFFNGNNQPNEELIAFNKAYNETTAFDYFEEHTVSDLALEDIIFDDFEVEEITTQEDLLFEEVIIDPAELMSYDDEYDFFE